MKRLFTLSIALLMSALQFTFAPETLEAVDGNPQFPGGQAALVEYLCQNLRYPYDAQRDSIQGRVFVSFVVDKDGSVVCVNVAQSVHPSIDKEAVRVVEGMPKWKPGMNKGKNVRVKFTLPITFRLPEPPSSPQLKLSV